MIDFFTVFSRLIISAVVVLYLSACSSSIVTIERYGFKILQQVPDSWEATSAGSEKTIAIYPVRLPSYLDTRSIVSYTNTQKILVSRSHVWAGDLSSETTRILSSNLSLLLPEKNILRFPWGPNIEPDYSLRIVVDEMSGRRGGELVLKAQWQIFDPDSDSGDSNRVFRKEFKESASSDSYNDYVAACNRLLEKLSLALASELKFM